MSVVPPGWQGTTTLMRCHGDNKTTHHCFVAVVYGPILRPDLSVELTIAIVTIQDARHSHHAEEMPRGT